MTTVPGAGGDRRHFLRSVLNRSIALAAGAMGALLGVFALKPAGAAPGETWVQAGNTSALTPGMPMPRVLSVSREDGWYRERARTTVFLVWDGDRSIRAFSAICTHLGCQVGWNAQSRQFMCPCHGGVFTADGRVVSGPPPRGLDVLGTELRTNGDVMVRL